MAQDTAAGTRTDASDHHDVAPPVIVVGLDGSRSSWDAFYWAAGEALRLKGKIVAVHVIPFTEPAASFGVPFDSVSLEQARHEVAVDLESEAARRAHDLGVPVCFVTEHGDVPHVLTEVARGLRANLVVVGRSAKRLHHLAGSLSHRLTSRNDAPVVVVVP